MSTTTQQIENIVSIVQENATIAEQNANMANAVNLISMSNEELMLGKQKIVDAINKMGGSASIDDTLSGLAKALRKLGMLDPEIGLTDDVPKPINLGDWLVGEYGKYLKTAKSNEVTNIESGFQSTTLEEVNFPNATSMVANTLYKTHIKGRINLPKIQTTMNGSFNNVVVDDIILPAIKELGGNAFMESIVKNRIELPNVTTFTAPITFQSCKAKEIICPNLYSVKYQTFESSAVEILDVSNFNGLFNTTYKCLNNCTKLIDFIIGANVKSDWNISGMGYNPTEAYLKTSASLCYDTDLERYGQRFSRNWDKWKWCIINHMAANFEDRTGLDAFTITFGNTVLSQFDEEMIEAFTSKNWTLA